MRVIDLENITGAMRSQTQFVLRCEEVFHDKISAAAAAILSAYPKKPYVALPGPSGSGKTTTAMRLKTYLENLGLPVCLLSMDNFFLSLEERPKELTDWESPLCVNWALLRRCMEELSAGQTAQVPWYDFPGGKTSSSRASTCSTRSSLTRSVTARPAFTSRPGRASSPATTTSSVPSRSVSPAA